MVDKGVQPARPRPGGFERGKPCRECSGMGVGEARSRVLRRTVASTLAIGETDQSMPS